MKNKDPIAMTRTGFQSFPSDPATQDTVVAVTFNFRLPLLILLFLCLSLPSMAQKTEVPFWEASIIRNGKIVLTNKERSETVTLQPAFQLFSSTEDPRLSLPLVKHLAYRIPAWQNMKDKPVTNDLFRAVTPSAFVVKKVERQGNEIRWIF